jgi:hypothetical protein
LAQTTAGQSVVVGVRPEALALALGQELPRDVGLLPGAVQMIEPDYGRRVQYVRLDTPVGDVTVTDTTNEPLAITQQVQVVLPADRAYFFDAETGARLG